MQYMRKIRLIHRYRRHVAEFLANSELTKTKYIKAVTFYWLLVFFVFLVQRVVALKNISVQPKCVF